MNIMFKKWMLVQGGKILWYLSEYDYDQPITFRSFKPIVNFYVVEPLFKTELDLLNRDLMEDWLEAYAKIDALGLVLFSSIDNDRIDEPLIHVENDRAWFRT